MMAGVIASEGLLQTQSSGGPVAGEGTLNFVTNTYDFASVSYVVADVVDHDEYRTANGLEIPAGSVGGSAQIILTPFTAKLASCQWTMLVVINVATAGNKQYIFTETDASETYWIEVVNWGTWYCDCSDGTFAMAEDTVNSQTSGIHKFAVTRINNKVSVSVDGNTVVSDTAAVILPVLGFPMTKFYFGGYGGGTEANFYLRSCAIFDPIDDAALPALST